MAFVITTYFRHTFTWSDQGISGEKLGWGITASSVPEDKRLLRDLEKLASAATPDYRSRVPVEMLLYSPACGYVKMTVMPRKGGNSGRKNKMVRMYQMSGPALTPAAYLSPGDEWGPAAKGHRLAPVDLEAPDWKREDFADWIGGPREVEQLLSLVYRTVCGDMKHLNFVAPDWDREDFAGNARQVMFLIHGMLPESLRRRAGYISYARERMRNIPFVFSPQPVEEHVFYLGRENQVCQDEIFLKTRESCLVVNAFFEGLAQDYLSGSRDFEDFLKRANDFLSSGKGIRNPLEHLAYIYFSMPGHEDRMPPVSVIRQRVPDLLFWGASDPDFAEVEERILDQVHRECPDLDEAGDYMNILMAGCTKRTMDKTSREILWILQDTDKDEEELLQLLTDLKAGSPRLYDKITGSSEEEKVENDLETGEDPEDIPVFIRSMIDQGQMNMTGPGDSFSGKKADQVTKENQVTKADQVTKDKAIGKVETFDSLYETKDMNDAMKAPVKGDERRHFQNAQVRAVQDGMEDSLTFLITGIVQGFMTGCMMYLSHYTIRLGHWKIALGLLGVWIPVMVNYWYILRQKGEWRPLWKIWGLCLTEGLIIETAAWFFPTQKIRLYFFIVLGIIVFLIQVAGILRLMRKRRSIRREDPDGD